MDARPFLVSLFPLVWACSPELPFASRSSAAVEPGLVLAIVHPGGGNTGAAFDRDFVVVVNRASTVRPLAGLSLQYASGAGTVGLGATETTRADLPDLVLEPGQAMLVAGAGGAGNGASLGAADVEDPTPIALATGSGRLALVEGTTALGCNGGSIPCDDAALARIVDRVAWGSAPFAEGEAMPAPANDQVLARRADGCVDTDSNREDLERVASFVRRRSEGTRPCGADGGVVEIDAGADLEAGVDAGSTGPGLSPAAIQGEGYRSPFEGRLVQDVRGTVTFVDTRRFAIEEPASPTTASGLFVETRGDPGVFVGQRVSVDGRVEESRPSCADCGSQQLGVTTLVASRVVASGVATPPEPVPIDAAFPRRLLPAPADLETRSSLAPDDDALDRLERLEGRRVRIAGARIVGPTRGLSSGRRLALIPDGLAAEPSTIYVATPAEDDHGGVFVVSGSVGAVLPTLDAGDRLDGELVGVVDTEDGRPLIRAARFEGARRVPRSPPTSAPLESDAWTVASLNLHGISAVDPPLVHAEVARAIVGTLGAPDVLVLQEIADDSGERDDGTTSAEATIAALTEAIRLGGGPAYEAYALDPRDGEDGGAPGANIRSAVLLRRDRGFAVPRREGAPDSPRMGIVRGDAPFAPNPARFGVEDPAFADSRKPLLLEIERAGESLVILAVHLSSHLGDPPRLGRLRPAPVPSDARRLAQAIAIGAWVEALLAVDPERSIAIVGDFNDGAARPTMAPLIERGLVAAPAGEHADEGTYVFDGIATNFDRAFLSPALAIRVRSSEALRLGAARAEAFTDHDPIVIRLGPRDGGGRVASCSLDARPRGALDPCAWAIGIAVVALGIRRSRRCP